MRISFHNSFPHLLGIIYTILVLIAAALAQETTTSSQLTQETTTYLQSTQEATEVSKVSTVKYTETTTPNTLVTHESTLIVATNPVADETNVPNNFTATTEASQFITDNTTYTKNVTGNLDNPKDYKVYIEESGHPVSYWHDIPLIANKQNKTYNMIVEIPRGHDILTNINLGEELNPITAVLHENGRVVKEALDYVHHFGKLPQTYNSPEIEDEHAQLYGTGKPLDILDISQNEHNIGDIIQVKILGVLGVIDNGKVDWKIIAFDTSSPLAEQIRNLKDVETLYPDLLQSTRGYFRFYRFPDQVNDMLFINGYKGYDTARAIINEKNSQWQDLVNLENPPNGIVTKSQQKGGH